MGTLLVPAAGGGVGMGGVSSCGDSPSPQLGAQNQVFSQVIQWKNVPLSPSSRSSSLRLINPFSAGG